jgi:hypothetical protein
MMDTPIQIIRNARPEQPRTLALYIRQIEMSDGSASMAFTQLAELWELSDQLESEITAALSHEAAAVVTIETIGDELKRCRDKNARLRVAIEGAPHSEHCPAIECIYGIGGHTSSTNQHGGCIYGQCNCWKRAALAPEVKT